MLLISNRISTFFSGTCFCQSFKNQCFLTNSCERR